MTLDQYLPPSIMKPKMDPDMYVEEKCAGCGKSLRGATTKYTLRVEGKVSVYCRECGRKILGKEEKNDGETNGKSVSE